MDRKYYVSEVIIPHYMKHYVEEPLDLYEIINRNLILAVLPCQLYEDYYHLENHELLKRYIRSDLTKQSLALFGGLSELGLSMWAANKTMAIYSDEIRVLNNIIYLKLEKLIHRLENQLPKFEYYDYDVISGLAGVINYCFLYKNEFYKLIIRSIDLYIAICVSLSAKQESESINLSMSHGILGPLYVMAKACSEGIDRACLKECINYLITLLYDISLKYCCGFPYRIDSNSDSKYAVSERDSWSFGSTVICWTLLQAAKSIKNDALMLYYKRLFLQRVESVTSLQDYHYISSCIINGHSGMLAVLKSYASFSDDQIILNRINEIELHLLSKFRPDSKYGFPHYEYRLSLKSDWLVKKYDNKGFAYGALGVILSLDKRIDIIKNHLLI